MTIFWVYPRWKPSALGLTYCLRHQLWQMMEHSDQFCLQGHLPLISHRHEHALHKSAQLHRLMCSHASRHKCKDSWSCLLLLVLCTNSRTQAGRPKVDFHWSWIDSAQQTAELQADSPAKTISTPNSYKIDSKSSLMSFTSPWWAT